MFSAIHHHSLQYRRDLLLYSQSSKKERLGNTRYVIPPVVYPIICARERGGVGFLLFSLFVEWRCTKGGQLIHERTDQTREQPPPLPLGSWLLTPVCLLQPASHDLSIYFEVSIYLVVVWLYYSDQLQKPNIFGRLQHTQQPTTTTNSGIITNQSPQSIAHLGLRSIFVCFGCAAGGKLELSLFACVAWGCTSRVVN